MKKNICKLVFAFLSLISLTSHPFAQYTADTRKILEKTYNLVPAHSRDTQYFEMESILQKHALNGTITGTEVYRLYLRCVPASSSSGKDAYTCLKFTVQTDNAEALIPSLNNWTYYFALYPHTPDTSGLLFGIDHSKFEKLTDAGGKGLPLENTFHVYNAFIDFHSMSVFAEKTPKDSGVQDLKHIGDKIVHSAAFSQPEENLGSWVARGSYFKNGKITLHFKGLGIINHRPCAILEYDSGESSFHMLMKPMPNMETTTTGRSHYWGDIHKDLTGGWIQKAVLHEIVVSETVVQGMSNKINSVIERTITIKNVKRPKF